MINTVLFDLYRTLIDIQTDEHDPFVYEALSRYLSYHLVRVDADRLRTVFFGEIERMLRESCEPHPEIDVYRIFGTIMERFGTGGDYGREIVRDTARLYRSLTMRRFGLFPQVPETLSALKESYRLGLVSDAQWVYADPEMAMLDLDRFFEVTVISSRLGFKKPDPRMFRIALERLHTEPGQAVYVGDNPDRDLRGAKAAGMRCILFNCEYREYDGLWPDGVFGEYGELCGIIETVRL